MTQQGYRCKVCGVDCDKFYLQKGRIFCDDCFMRYTNKAVRYKIRMRKINKILSSFVYILLVILAFIIGIAIGVMW